MWLPRFTLVEWIIILAVCILIIVLLLTGNSELVVAPFFTGTK